MMENPSSERMNNSRPMRVVAGALDLQGELSIPQNARGIVLLAEGSRNIERLTSFTELANAFQNAGLATLLVPLLTEDEEQIDSQTQFFRYNVSILHQRIIGIANWLEQFPETQNLSIGYFGIGSVGAAALIAAAERPDSVHALVVRNGRIDLAQPYLSHVKAPTFLIAGESDNSALRKYQEALSQMPIKLEANKKIENIVSSAGLSETTETLKQVADLAGQWFARHLVPIV